MRANQLRLWFASMAYVLMCALRRIGLADTEFAGATCGRIRLRLLKIGTLVRVRVRRVKIAHGLRLHAAASGRGTDHRLTPPATNQTAHSSHADPTSAATAVAGQLCATSRPVDGSEEFTIDSMTSRSQSVHGRTGAEISASVRNAG